jgi:hypothetical protein
MGKRKGYNIRTERPTVLSHHAPHPRAKVIHLPHAPPNLPRMTRPIRLPLPTVMTPLGPPVALAHEDVPRVEGLQARAVRVLVRHRVRRHAGRRVGVVGAAQGGVEDRARARGPAGAEELGAAGVGEQGDEAGLGLDDPEDAEVAGDADCEEDEVEGEEDGGCARLVALADEVVG